MASYSRCPAPYSRPRVVVLHSVLAWSRDVATYFGAQLVFGGYTEVDVAPVRKASSSGLETMSIKELKQYLKGVSTAGATERVDLLELAKRKQERASGGPIMACRHSESSRRKALGRAIRSVDMRIHEDPFEARVESAAMIFCVVSSQDDAKLCASFVRSALEDRATDKKEVVPVVILTAPGPAFFSVFDNSFGDDAVPMKKGYEAAFEEEEAKKARPFRDLGGKAVVIAGALGFGALRRADDDALVALNSKGKIVLERLDKEREESLSKFYDLLSSLDMPLCYAPRANMTTSTWGALLVQAPLLAAATLSTEKTYGESLARSRPLRVAAAAAIKEARLALALAADRVKRRKDAMDDQPKRSNKKLLWKPKVDAAQASPFLSLFEWLLSAPNVVFRFLVAPYLLGLAHNALVPDSQNASLLVDELLSGCAGRPVPTLEKFKRALAQRRIDPDFQLDHTSLAADTTGNFFSSLAVATLLLLAAVALFLLLELTFPDQTDRSFFSGTNEL